MVQKDRRTLLRADGGLYVHINAVLLIGTLLASSTFTACSSSSGSPAGPASSSPVLPSPPLSPSEEASCVAANAQSAVGKRASDQLLESARVASGAKVARFLRPNQAVTMEYSGARLNLALDQRDVVVGATCG
jgi:hypothetical protein